MHLIVHSFFYSLHSIEQNKYTKGAKISRQVNHTPVIITRNFQNILHFSEIENSRNF